MRFVTSDSCATSSREATWDVAGAHPLGSAQQLTGPTCWRQKWGQPMAIVATYLAGLLVLLVAMPLAVMAQDDEPDGLLLRTTEDPAVFDVTSRPHEHDGLPTGGFELATGPDDQLWVFDGQSVRQAGAQGRHPVPSAIGFVKDFAVDDESRLWFATDRGLASFDGERWKQHWSRGYDVGLDGVAAMSDGSVVAVGTGHLGRKVVHELIVVRADTEGSSAASLGEPIGEEWWVTPRAIAVTPDDEVWIGAMTPFAVFAGGSFGNFTSGLYSTQGFLIRTDGESLERLEPLAELGSEGPGVAALADGPDGSVWALLWHAPDGGDPEPVLARYDASGWELDEIPSELPGRPGSSLAVTSDGIAWMSLDLASDEGGVASFDGESWTTYVPGTSPSAITVGADDSVWWTYGGLQAVRSEGAEPLPRDGIIDVMAAYPSDTGAHDRTATGGDGRLGIGEWISAVDDVGVPVRLKVTKVKPRPGKVLGDLGRPQREGSSALSAFFRYQGVSDARPGVPLEFHVFVDGEWAPGLVGASPAVRPALHPLQHKKAAGWIIFEVPARGEVVLVRDALDGENAIEIVLRAE